MPIRAPEAEPLPVAGDTAAVPVARLLAAAIVLPLGVTLLALVPWLALLHLDGSDRALVWVAGSDQALQSAVARAETHAAFVGGASTAAESRPASCPAKALRLHFDIARVDEAQAARHALETIAADAGAHVCASHRFELNRGQRGTVLWAPLAASLLLPAGLVLAMHLAAATGAGNTRGPPMPRRHAASMLIAGVGAACLLPLPGGGTPWQPGALPLLAIALVPPAVHEAAFRGWLLPRLAAIAGGPVAAALSLAASVTATLPFADAPGVTMTALAAAAACMVFVRTGSLAACVGTHLLVAALLRGAAAFAT